MTRCPDCGQRTAGGRHACPAPAPLPEVPGYRVERLLGRGGFSTVVAASGADGGWVALKVASAGDAIAAEQLANEEAALREVGPPAVPAVLGAGRAGESPWLALELVDLPTLGDRLEEAGGPFSRGEFASRAAALIDAAAAVHAKGYAHLDLKPENVFLAAESARLIDFGLARRLSETRAPRGFAGTAEYASPEQCEERPELDERADLYAIGVMLYQMLAGRPPFTGAPNDVRQAHAGLRPPRPSAFAPVAPAIEQVVLRCLAKDRARRYQTARELRAALDQALATSDPGRTPATADPAAAARPKLERRQAGLLFFASSADAGSVQSAVRTVGGELGFAARGRFAAIFAGEAGQDPVRRAFRAAQGIVESKLAVRALIDLGPVNAQRKPDGQLRWLAPELGREPRYPRETDPLGPLATSAAAELLADVGWEPLAARAGVLQLRPGESGRVQTATVVQLGAGALVGREDLLRSLFTLAKAASTGGGPSIATVVAQPGHGKTHLAAALLDELRVRLPHAEVLDLRAREPVAGDADETLRALFFRALDLAPGASDQAVRGQFAAAVGAAMGAELWPAVALSMRLLPPDATVLRRLGAAPGVLRSMAVRAAGETLRARARRRPLCLLLDDAQFADDAALDALEYAAISEAATPLFVCALGRPSFAEARRSFGERAAHRELHILGPLEPERAAELCRRLLAPAENVPAAAVDRLVERTQGIPLLLVELVRGLKRDGLVRQRARGGSWFVATDELERLPDSPLIEWLAEREIGALPAELAAHARLVALLGAEFAPAEAEGVVAEVDEEGLGAGFPLDANVATRRLVGIGLLLATRASGFRYRHALVRDAVARSMAPAQAERLHRAAARFYRKTRIVPDVRRLPLLARHAARAGLREEAAAVYLGLAESARERHAYVDAEQSYTNALELLAPGDVAGRLAARRGRGSTRYRISRTEDALVDLADARALARQLGNTGAEAEILLDQATALDWTSDYVRSRELVEEAAPLAEGRDNGALQAALRFGRGRSLFRAGQRAEACTAFGEAVALAEQAGDAGYETLTTSLVMLQVVLPDLGRLAEAELVSARAVALSRERGDLLHLRAALNNRRNVRVARKDAAGAVADQRAAMGIARDLGLVLGEYFGELNLSELLYQIGDLDEAAGHAGRAVEIETRHPEVARRPIGLLRMARIEAYRGREPEARELIRRIEELVREAREEGRGSGVLTGAEQVLLRMADLATRDSSAAEWEELLERSARVSLEQEPIEVAELLGVWGLRRGKPELSRRGFDEALARAARIPNVMDERLRRGAAALAQ